MRYLEIPKGFKLSNRPLINLWIKEGNTKEIIKCSEVNLYESKTNFVGAAKEVPAFIALFAFFGKKDCIFPSVNISVTDCLIIH